MLNHTKELLIWIIFDILQNLVTQQETTLKKNSHDSENDKIKDLQKQIVQINKEKKVFLKHLAIFASIVFDKSKFKIVMLLDEHQQKS